MNILKNALEIPIPPIPKFARVVETNILVMGESPEENDLRLYGMPCVLTA
jgi:hypothetical protein